VLDRDVGQVRLRQHAVKPMVGMRVAVHYGCHLIRPSQDLGFDNPFEPSRFDQLVEAIGAESVPYESKMLCCGGQMSRIDDEELGRHMVRTKLRELKRLDVDAMVLACPSCMLQYDVTQSVLMRRGEELGIPVLYYTELLGLAMGIEPDELGLSSHRVEVTPFLEKWQRSLDELAGLAGRLDLRRVQNCAECGACVLECPVAQTDLNYDPNALMRALAAGRLEEVLRSRDLWKCHDCFLCAERCWQGWSMVDTFREVKRMAIERGLAPEPLAAGLRTLEAEGRLAKPSAAQRKKLGLPPVADTGADEVRRMLEASAAPEEGDDR
jgi:heterodisulfide reductase subunit C